MASQSQHQSDNIGSSSTGSGSVNASSTQSDDLSNAPPLWKYVTKIEKIGTVGGTWKYKCKFCNGVRTSSYSRVRAHLLQLDGHGVSKCKGVSYADKLEMQRIDKDYEERKSNSGPREVPLPSETKMDVDTSQKKRRSANSPIARCFGIEARDQLDQEIARMFFTAGLPFNLARNPHYMRAFTFAASHSIAGYKPPGYNKLRTTLVVQERTNMEKLLLPLMSTWKEKGVTIVSDGWSDPTRKPLINFMVTSGNGPMFLKAVNCFGEVKDKFFIANLMKEVIREVGHQNVVQIITDNAANCKGAGELIESEFPHIYWTPCVVHTLNLALKNICAPRNLGSNVETYEQCSWINEVHGDAIQIKNFIMNHNMRLSMFQKYSPLKLLSVADTRFASIIVMLKRFRLIKRGLQAMVISEEWASYREEDMGKANFVKEKILNDDWWDKVAYILDFTRPIYDMIRYCDTDKPCLHLVYEMWDSMIEKVKLEIYKKEKRVHSDFSPFYYVVYEILVSRWAKNNTPLHCLAHSLNPRYILCVSLKYILCSYNVILYTQI